MSVSRPRSEPLPRTAATGRNGAIPPLENGDHLTRDEFMRRYEAMPNLKKAELIEGVVHVPSPVRQRYHGRQHSHTLNWLGHYEAGTPGVESGDNTTTHLDLNTSPQPDAVLFVQPEHGGRVKFDEDGYIVGAPELVAEIAASSVSYDLHEKLRAYQRCNVREYIVWRILDAEIDWFVLRDQGYEKLDAADDGILRSVVFPGLWLSPAALMNGDLSAVFAVVERGLGSREHIEFVERLRQDARNKG